jgi:hypothetical protein
MALCRWGNGAHLLFQMCLDLSERVSMLVMTKLHKARLQWDLWGGENGSGARRLV